MLNLRIIGKKGSKAKLAIVKATGIRQFKGNNVPVDAVINYGLAGDRLTSFLSKYKSLNTIKLINRSAGKSKLHVVNLAEKNKIKVPESKRSLTKNDILKDWIEKRYNSIGGIGIISARSRNELAGKYYQRFIKNRKYELRIHAFSWVAKDKWVVQKRLGSKDVIAWNYHNGGKFVTVSNPSKFNIFVEARDIADKILEISSLSFGAVDLIVTEDNELYFIEVNSAPGFTELSAPIYIWAFNELKKLSKLDILKMR